MDYKALMEHALRNLATVNVEDRASLVAKVQEMHRTEQQGLMRFFVMLVRNMATWQCDARNEASVKLAQKICELDIKDLCLPRI